MVSMPDSLQRSIASSDGILQIFRQTASDRSRRNPLHGNSTFVAANFSSEATSSGLGLLPSLQLLRQIVSFEEIADKS
jgi:hypothetical protein